MRFAPCSTAIGAPCRFTRCARGFLGNIASPVGVGFTARYLEGSVGAAGYPNLTVSTRSTSLLAVLIMGLWNRLSKHQERSAPFRLLRVDISGTREGLAGASLLRREELDGFIYGLFGKEESLELPERARRALTALSENARDVGRRPRRCQRTSPSPRQLMTIAQAPRQQSVSSRGSAEREIHRGQFYLARGQRRQTLRSMPTAKPSPALIAAAGRGSFWRRGGVPIILCAAGRFQTDWWISGCSRSVIGHCIDTVRDSSPMTLHKEQLRRGPPEPPDPLPRPGRAPHLAVGAGLAERLASETTIRPIGVDDLTSNRFCEWRMGMAVVKRELGRTDGTAGHDLGLWSDGTAWGPACSRHHRGPSRNHPHKVLDAGINYIDTSIDYGLSEERIGRYISRTGALNIISPANVAVWSAHPPHRAAREGNTSSPATMSLRGVEQSLVRMKTDISTLCSSTPPHPGRPWKSTARSRLLGAQRRRQGAVYRHVWHLAASDRPHCHGCFRCLSDPVLGGRA